MSALMLTLFLSMGAAPEGIYTYRGSVIADKGDPIDTKKTFSLSVLVHKSPGGPRLYWTISESGRGAWPWPARFGRAELDPKLKVYGGQSPTLLYRHENGSSPVKLLSPLYLAPKTLGKGVNWKQGKLEYRVADARRLGTRQTWRIHVRTPYGRKRTVLVDQKVPLVVAMRETVFIGQGQQHELTMRLVKSEKVADTSKVIEAFQKLGDLRTKAKLEPKKARLSLSKVQLALLRKNLPSVSTLAAKTLLEPVVAAANRETKVQRGRSGAVAELRRRAMAKTFKELTFTTLRKNKVKIKTTGKITVLHFWSYQDKPLQEPYGQVGYLDFLNRRSKGNGKLQVYGVAVNQQLGRNGRVSSALRSARKLRSFMNLGYNVVADPSAEVLAKLGDPRVTGSRLPLFVVLNEQGKVIHYKVGFYRVRRDRGLELLQQVVTSALKNVQ